MSNDCNDQISTQTQTQGNPLHSVPRGKSFVTYNLACNSTFNIVVSKTDDIKGASVFHHLMKTQMHLNPPPLSLVPNTNQELRDVIEEDGGIKSDPA